MESSFQGDDALNLNEYEDESNLFILTTSEEYIWLNIWDQFKF